MVLLGENITTGGSDKCTDCGKKLEFMVCQSNAGYYVGTWCCCGPFSRESGYYRSRDEAQKALDSGKYGR